MEKGQGLGVYLTKTQLVFFKKWQIHPRSRCRTWEAAGLHLTYNMKLDEDILNERTVKEECLSPLP